ncbi:MAG: type II secretion system protein, partial [Alphaproteobacteria bacterium]|nr:type II secretion system protein [Alphaproteobacteria bacterium]
MKLFYIEQKGRSMIEMLGVLAIVGILSVGAISGYSTAMRKYKINRLKDEYTQFIHDVLLYDNEWKKMARQNPDVKLFSIQNYVTQMNLLPKLWILDKTGWIIDSMGGRFTLFVRQGTGKIDIDYQTKGKQKSNADAKDLCIAMVY